MRRRPLFAANWKMHKTPAQAADYVNAFLPLAEPLVAGADIALLPPFIDLETVARGMSGTSIALGAQDCYWEPQGAFTGEVSAAMLKAVGASYCVVGHSERRRLFGETDAAVARKVAALMAVDITPIVCVGESLEENQAGRTHERVMQQIRDGLGALSDAQRATIVIAYEPVWAIGTGLADSPESACRTIRAIRKAAGGLEQARILYGGSMNAANVLGFCGQPDINGGLIGSASLDPQTFARLIEAGSEIAHAG